MSLNAEITRIENAKDDLKEAIEEKGVTVGDGAIDTYATAVRSIQTGVGTETDPVFTASPAYGITSNDITNWNGKSTFSGNYNDLSNKPDIKNALIVTYDETNNVASHTPQEIKNAMDSGRDVYFKQDGNGEIFFAPVLDASATLGKCYIVKDGYNTIVPALYSITIDSQKSVSSNYQLLQEKLVSGTNIKTINNTSILGSGNIDISGGSNYTALNIAPLYSSSSTYSVGDYVIYNNLLYACSTAISIAEAWNSSHWTRTTVIDIIKSLHS